jgi:arylsulfatase A-like enzyme
MKARRNWNRPTRSPMPSRTPIRSASWTVATGGAGHHARHIRRARQGYFANISYVDDKIGEILATLEATRQEAVVLFLSDHGEMLGERGLWFKMNFFEGSARVPLMIAAPGLAPGRIDTPVIHHRRDPHAVPTWRA